MNLATFILAIICISQAGPLAKLAAAPPELISFWRMGFACIVMFAVTLIQGDGLNEYRQIKGRIALWAIASGVSFWLFMWCYQFSAQNTTIANLMIIYSLNPLVTALISVVGHKEKFNRSYITAYLLAFTGVYLQMSQGSGLILSGELGVIAAFGAALFYSLYLLSGQQVRTQISNPVFTASIYGITCLCFLLTTAARGVDFFNYPAITWYSVAGLIIIPTLLGHTLLTYLLKHFNINWLSIGKLGEPVIASITAFALFDQKLGWVSVTAFTLTGASLLILILNRTKTA